MDRLKRSEIKEYRDHLQFDQEDTCPLCGELLTKMDHLDHNHKTGMIRAVLHRECNTLLGKIENFLNTYGHPNAEEFLKNVWPYLAHHSLHPSYIYHPSYRTDEEKRLARNKKARQARAAKKEKK